MANGFYTFVFFSRPPDSILIFKEEPHLQQYLGYYKYFYKFLFFLNSPTSTLYFSPDSHDYSYIWNYCYHDPYTYFYLFVSFVCIQLFFICFILYICHQFIQVEKKLVDDNVIDDKRLDHGIKFLLFYFNCKITIVVIAGLLVLFTSK